MFTPDFSLLPITQKAKTFNTFTERIGVGLTAQAAGICLKIVKQH
jgi:hypothetical protein